jgi:hypothetical protein
VIGVTERLGGIGVWEAAMRYGDPAAAGDYAAEVEELGYSALWVPDAGGDLSGALRSLLASTSAITVASGILNLWVQDPTHSAAGFHEHVAKYGPQKRSSARPSPPRRRPSATDDAL